MYVSCNGFICFKVLVSAGIFCVAYICVRASVRPCVRAFVRSCARVPCRAPYVVVLRARAREYFTSACTTLCATQRSSPRPRFSCIRASSWACLLVGRLYLPSLDVDRCISTFIPTTSSFCSTVNELFQLHPCHCLYRLLGFPESLVFVAWKLWRAEPPYYSIFYQQRLY